MAVVTLLTDFGDSPYPGTMKGVIRSLAPGISVVDLYHHVPMGNVEVAAYVLYHSHGYFPSGSVHVAVVDPGVGSDRKVIMAQAGEHLFVAPDNGLLTLVMERIEGVRVFALKRWEFTLPHRSSTFHGRDVFAPLGAWLALGVPMPMMGEVLDSPVFLDLPKPLREGTRVLGRVLWVDPFGNLVTNVERKDVGDLEWVEVAGKRLSMASCYAQLPPGEVGAIWNSWNLLEIFSNGARASDILGLGPGEKVSLKVSRL